MNVFTNIGGKIKGLAKVVCWIGIIISCIMGIMMMFSSMSQYNSGVGMGLGLLYIVFGALVSWISSLALYGFGELIEKTSEIAENTRKLAADAHRP